jgi:L,D-peptidoglycan transpeptidase YkuD (ErfK/YbiS/YcfS/YnhG family)
MEGDKKTPKGIFSIGNLYYRKDRISKFETKLKTIQIKKRMGWCDDINNKYYNKPIKIKKNIKHEKLFRKDHKYDLLIPINYNTKPIIKNKGSAIFIHLTKNYKKTAGCVAISKKDFLILLKLINSKTKIKIF